MLVDGSTFQALAIIGGVGGLAGVIGGFVASADNLIGTLLVGIIGGVALSAIFKVFGVTPIYGVGAEEFSVVWGALGGFVLGYVVGRANA